MAGNCCSGGCATTAARGRYRRILWIALLINLAMFGVEIGAGVRSGSVSLLADSLDFFGDAANYGVGLFVLGLGVVMRARASLAKRSEEHTSELQSLMRISYAVFCLKKKT